MLYQIMLSIGAVHLAYVVIETIRGVVERLWNRVKTRINERTTD